MDDIKPKIGKVIVAEGKDDVSAILRAVDAEIYTTGGLGLSEDDLKELEKISRRNGIIIFTDPDYAGEKIRRMVAARIPSALHAFIDKEKAKDRKNGKVGVEHASPGDILEALSSLRSPADEQRGDYTMADLLDWGLVMKEGSSDLREAFCEELGIGICSGKKLLKRLNLFNIGREDVTAALGRAETRAGI